MNAICSFKELRVWQNAMEIAMKIYEISKSFPLEERFSLTDRILCSSRSVVANITEGWRKQRYPEALISKLNDAESEVAKTQAWLEIAFRCGYLTQEEASYLDRRYEEVLKQLVAMTSHLDQWTTQPSSSVQCL